MRNGNVKAVAGLILRTLGLLALVSSAAGAEQLPIKTYTTTDGLVSNRISRIVRDSRGYLWFCTEDGLSRFDGYTFTKYTTQQGLPSNWVDAFLETGSGIFLVGTGAGLCVFDPKGEPLPQERVADQPNAKPMFTNSRPDVGELSPAIKVLYEDSLGNIWCGTNHGFYRVEIADGQIVYHEVSLGMSKSERSQNRIRSIVEEKSGVLWVLTDWALVRYSIDGTAEICARTEPSGTALMDMVRDPEGTLWVSTRKGLWTITQTSSGTTHIVTRKYGSREGLSCVEMTRIYQDYSGTLWAGTDYGLFEFLKKEDRFRLRLGIKDIKDARIWSFNEDSVGNLWIGTANGAIRLARGGFSTFTESDGLGFRDVCHITEPVAGEINLYTRFGDSNLFVDKFDGERFISRKVVPRAFRIQAFSLYLRQIPIRDHLGEWWWPTGRGLFRYGKAEQIDDIIRALPVARYTTKDGLPSDSLGGIYEDRRGDIWIFALATSDGGLVRWDRASSRFNVYSSADGLPAKALVVSVCEDGAGNLWMGFFDGGIARYRQGRFTAFDAADGVPQGKISQLFPDSQGRVWIASNDGGLGKIDEVSEDHPKITTYTTANGLASDSILCVAEDRANQFYVATNRGLNHVNFDTGGVKRFTTNDGLANNQVDTIFRDSRGAFWFGTVTGLSRLLPAVEAPPKTAPPIFINSLKIAGQSRHISEIGETDIRGPALTPGQNQIEIGFGSLLFGAGDSILYRYKLEGADGDWQPLTAQRTVNFANLAPGAYRFLVQAVNSDGVMSEAPGIFAFSIMPPVWQRWWVLALAGVLLCLAVYSTYRLRLAQKLKVERVRTRIATDLHDDIGTNLSLIAMASEVARGRASKDDQRMTEALSLISGTSRELVDSMSDIVWAVNPKRDRLVDLTKRMRRFASDLFSARSIAFHFEAPSDDRDIRLGTETRREVLLIFKEAVSNIARHSECTRADIELKAHGGVLVMKLSDNGKGFDTGAQFDGNGLISMGQRADRMGGRLDVISRNGDGTTVTLKTSLK